MKKLAVLAATAVLLVGLPTYQASAAADFNVRDFGAVGDGETNDTPAINDTIEAASEAGGGTVVFPEGTYLSSNTIHLRSDITIQLDAGATVEGSDDDDYDPPEDNPWDEFQDFGHSHFHNAMFFGDGLRNIAFVGAGTLDGGDHLITGNPDDGEADKIVSLTRCDGLRFDGITLRRGGHFAILTNACNNITSDNLTIDTAGDRDGWNVINAKNVTITNANFEANDDALAFKSDWALGQTYDNGNVTVTDSHLSAECCNALMFGSETCGDFTGYDFQRITIAGAQKSGLGMVSMDGTNISDVHYKDIEMSGTRSPIMQKIGDRRRCGDDPGIGTIRNITYENITGTYDGSDGEPYSPTLWGNSSENNVSDVTFTNVNLTVPGGSDTIDTGVPDNDSGNYNPNSVGDRPAYGWYLHNANNITFSNSSVRFEDDDGRPAVIANSGSSVRFDGFTAQVGDSPADLIFQGIDGYCVVNSQDPDGGELRVENEDSSEGCAEGNGSRQEGHR